MPSLLAGSVLLTQGQPVKPRKSMVTSLPSLSTNYKPSISSPPQKHMPISNALSMLLSLLHFTEYFFAKKGTGRQAKLNYRW